MKRTKWLPEHFKADELITITVKGGTDYYYQVNEVTPYEIKVRALMEPDVTAKESHTGGIGYDQMARSDYSITFNDRINTTMTKFKIKDYL